MQVQLHRIARNPFGFMTILADHALAANPPASAAPQREQVTREEIAALFAGSLYGACANYGVSR